MNQSPDVVYIYALCESDTGRVRYVGSTVDPDARLKGHTGPGASPQVMAWVQEVSGRGAVPIMRVIDTATPDRRDVVERRWIRRMERRTTLVNTRWVGVRPARMIPTPRVTSADLETGRAAAVRRSYRLAPDVIQRIEEIARAESTTATAVIEAAVRAYRGGVEARVAALESWRESIEGRPVDGDSSTGQAGAIPPIRL